MGIAKGKSEGKAFGYRARTSKTIHTGSAPLLGALLARAGAVPAPMPAEVRVKAPKRVQEAMQVVEDYVAGLDDGGAHKP